MEQNNTIQELKSVQWEAQIINDATTFKIVEFGATWCGPCRALQATLVEINKELHSDKLKFYKVNVETEDTLVEQFAINAVPTLIIFGKTGEEIARVNGALTKDKLVIMLSNYIK